LEALVEDAVFAYQDFAQQVVESEETTELGFVIPGSVALLLGEMKDTGGEEVDELADVRFLLVRVSWGVILLVLLGDRRRMLAASETA
jgi:hypothetical protein